jgi:hypothetical protein
VTHSSEGGWSRRRTGVWFERLIELLIGVIDIDAENSTDPSTAHRC